METFEFKKAKPIWSIGREKEKNCELAFRAILGQGQMQLCLAASTIYRVWINGIFVAAGPARTAHGYYCVDQIDLTHSLTEKENVLVIEVVGYNVNSYDTLDQPSFLTAEVICEEKVIAYTGECSIKVYDLHQRAQYVQRYSFQRAFVDCYNYKAENKTFYCEPDCNKKEECFCVTDSKKYLKRRVPIPQYEQIQVDAVLEVGRADFEYKCENIIRDRSVTDIGEKLKGYTIEELEERLSDEAQNMQFYPMQNKALEMFPQSLCNSYGLYSFSHNATGFLRLHVECENACTIYVLFDEILNDGRIDFLRMGSCNCFKYKLDAGKHDIMTFAPYTMKYVQIVAKENACLTGISMIEYKHPTVPYEVKLPEDDVLKKIYNAALESYRANALDIFMDCPSRERAGWLCDSFFTSRVEYVLTKKSVLEKAFLENFLLAEEFAFLPKGMLPMCYPADHNDGVFIPNWAMWFVLELEEYFQRSNDKELVSAAKERIYQLLDYFSSFENEDGLLEKLKGWVFVEWSRANDLDVVQDINFPSNMIYMKMLTVVSRLYGDKELEEKAKHLREIIRKRAIKGIFFTDNECRTAEGLVNPGNSTEVCQYYAFFTGVATKEEDPLLWQILCKEFGYQRKETELYPEVAFANAFIGNYLRIELLYQDGQFEEVIDNIRGYFTSMADRTGTLWEHDNPSASCNHGFASHVIYWMAKIYGV